jgi:glycosyltransferase involved in cell wall biosynthesis
MSTSKKFVFWQNMVSFHQSCFLYCLSLRDNVDVTLVAVTAMDEKREKMGWKVPDMGRTRLVVAPDEATINEILTTSDKDTVHIFSGFDREPHFKNAFAHVIKRGLRLGIMAEPYDWLGLKGKLRYVRSIYQRQQYGKKIDFILAIGNKGMEVYSKAGYKKEKLFEWGYFVQEMPPVIADEYGPFRVMYAGSLLPAKGLHTLVQAWSRLKREDIELNIIGEGPEYPTLKGLAEELALRNVRFSGFEGNDKIRALIGEHDLFVLPSILKEGWGAVVNEALIQGTPVICTDHCGASVLLGAHNYSTVIKAGDVDRLADEIDGRIRAGKTGENIRTEIRSWSECLSGEHAADYFLDIVKRVYEGGPVPRAPWRKKKEP